MGEGLSRRNFLKFGAFCGVGSVTGAYGLFSALHFDVNHYQIPVPNLPPSFHGFTIVQLTDLHHGFGIPIGVIDRVIAQVNALKKDVIVCTGDYIHGGDGYAAIDKVWSRLTALRAPSGVYSVLGNHDHMFNNTDDSLNRLEQSGQSVRHRALPITRGKERLWIGGAGDLWHDTLGIDEAFRNAPPEECKLLLAHNPESAETPFKTRVDLMISGHTHGGQIGVPPWSTSWSGLHSRGGTQIFVCRGIGWYLVPIRINAPPEIAVLTLVPAAPSKLA